MGELIVLLLIMLFFFNGSDIVMVIYKGVFICGDKCYLIDWNYVFNVEKVVGSDIYYIKGKKL